MTDKLRCDDCGAVIQAYSNRYNHLSIQCECVARNIKVSQAIPEDWL